MSNPTLVGTTVFTSLVYGLFIVGFWDSTEELSALVLVAAGVLAFFCVQPFLLSLADWRFAIKEEAEALLHTSLKLSRVLKALMAILLIIMVFRLNFCSSTLLPILVHCRISRCGWALLQKRYLWRSALCCWEYTRVWI